MPRLTHKTPAYSLHKSSGHARVRIDGREYWLGPHGSPQSLKEYDRLIAEWLSNGRSTVTRAESSPVGGLTMVEMLAVYWKWAEGHYSDPEGERKNIREALKPVRRLYGHSRAREFGPLALRAVRDEMVRSGLARTTVNARINRVRRVFKWAVGVELIPPTVYQALAAVEGLRKGGTKAREAEPIKPVDVKDVEQTLPYLSPAVRALAQIQLLTGCRMGEVVIMRGGDLNREGPIWEYRPESHKGSWRGQDRIIMVGPKAQAIIRPFLMDDPDAYLFSPRRTVSDLRHRRLGGRATSKVAPRYDRRSYRQAVVRACGKAGVPPWSPLQLRHAAATAIRREFGLEAAQVILGHARADVTQVYAEADRVKALEVARRVG